MLPIASRSLRQAWMVPRRRTLGRVATGGWRGTMRQWDRAFSWDIEWITTDHTALAHQQNLYRAAAEHPAQHWLQDKPGSQGYLYRRRGEVSVLVHVLSR